MATKKELEVFCTLRELAAEQIDISKEILNTLKIQNGLLRTLTEAVQDKVTREQDTEAEISLPKRLPIQQVNDADILYQAALQIMQRYFLLSSDDHPLIRQMRKVYLEQISPLPSSILKKNQAIVGYRKSFESDFRRRLADACHCVDDIGRHLTSIRDECFKRNEEISARFLVESAMFMLAKVVAIYTTILAYKTLPEQKVDA